MKTHTKEFKENIAKFGRELDSKITYTINGVTTELGNEQLNSVSPHYEGAILKSVMKQLDIDSNVEIPVGTELNYQLGVKVRSGKNLLPNNIKSQSINGLTVTKNSDGSLLINGVSNATTKLIFGTRILLNKGTYTISANRSGTVSNSIYIATINSANDTEISGTSLNVYSVDNKTYTLSQNYSVYIQLYIGNNRTFTNFLIKPQLELGETATTYEQYPYDYVNYGNYIVKEVEKQEDTRSYKITCYDKMLYSMKDYEKLTSKNLLNENNAKMSSNYSTQSGLSSSWKAMPIQLEKNKKYTISRTPTTATSTDAGYNLQVSLYESPNTAIFYLNNQTQMGNSVTSASYTFTTGNSGILYITTLYGNDTRLGTYFENVNVQIEKGSKVTSYTPYFQYPVTIRNYISNLCSTIGLYFKNETDNFANYDKQISSELYLSYDNETDTYSSLNYTFRDVLDELAQVTASTICINEETDKLEIRYINQTIGKNLFNKNGNFGGSNTVSVLDTGVKITQTSAGQYKYNSIVIGKDELLGKKVTITSNMSASANNTPALRLYFGSSSSTTSSHIGSLYSTGNTTITIPSSFPTNTDRIYLLVYSNRDGTGNINDYCEYTNLQIELGEEATSYEAYGDTIDEEYLKDVNVNFGEMFGAVNTIVLSRSADADNIYYPSTLPSNPIEIKIADNQIMNGNDRDTYMADIYNKLNGLYYYINDYSSTGICYYNLCDRYNVKIGDEFYSCIMLNDTANITQGLEEQIYVDMPEETNTDYTKADSTDRKINTAYIIANKAEASIQEVTRQIDNVNGTLDEVITTQTSTERTISILSTNIDPNTGEVNEVTTKEKRFTLNDSGLIITNSDTNFKSQQDETGTYYYDGENVIGQYTKDGSKQKDLQLFGVYYYGMDDKDDTPMFVTQLYTEDGEECVGHFYNGGDY